MLSRNVASRLEAWAMACRQFGDETAVAEISALRAFAVGRTDVFPWRPSTDRTRQEVTLPAHGLTLVLRFKETGQGMFYNGAVSESEHEVRWTGWSEDGFGVMRDLARLALDVMAQMHREGLRRYGP